MDTTDPADSGAPALLMAGVRRTYEAETAPVRALRGIDLVVGRGEFVALMGPSGCGKSTLLHIAAGLDRPDEGSVQLAGREITDAVGEPAVEGPAPGRGHGLPVLPPARGHDGRGERRARGAWSPVPRGGEAEGRAQELLDLLGLLDKAQAAPAALSGGQRQRLAIARALANSPTLLLADEPTGALDSDGADEVLALFRQLHAAGQSILMVTHNPDVAAGASRTVRLRDGVIAA